MRFTLDALSSSKTFWLLTLIALVFVLNPQAVRASENANQHQTLVFSGVVGDDVTVHSAQSSTLGASMIPETPERKPQRNYTVTKEKAKAPSNTVVATKNPPKSTPTPSTGTLAVTISSYTSTVEECDSSPFITASGSHVHMGTAAWNGMPFGTKFTIPEISGDLVYTVEDRGSMRVMGTHTVDLWRPTKAEAFAIGRRPATVVFVE